MLPSWFPRDSAAWLLQPQAAGGTQPLSEGLAFLQNTHHPPPPGLAAGSVPMPPVRDIQVLMEGCALPSLWLEMRPGGLPWGHAASWRWIKLGGQEGRGGAVSSGGLLCRVKPCHPALLVHPYHSHTYIRSSSWYVRMGTGVQTSCVRCHTSGNMLCVNILIHPSSWSGRWGFFGSPTAPFVGVMSCSGTAQSQLSQTWKSAEGD